MPRITFSTPPARRPLSTSCLLLLAVLSGLAVGAEGQIAEPAPPPGSPTPWSIPEPSIPDPDAPPEEARVGEWGSEKPRQWEIRCRIHEIEELGRLYVEDAVDGTLYWIQLPSKVKILAANSKDFDGRKKLKLEDLEVEQRLRVTLRSRDDEILKVRVWPPAKEPTG